MTAMRAIDAAFLAMERDDEPRHLGSLMVFDPSDDGPLDLLTVRALLQSRLPAMPMARRVVAPSTSGLTRPSWRTVEAVDLDVHLRDATLPDTSDPRRALDEHVAHLHASTLDRRRPLWQVHVIDGLPDDRVAIYAKVHMAAIDDQTGVGLMTALLDESPGGRPTMDDVEVHTERANRVVDRLVRPLPDQVRRGLGFPVRLAGRAARAAGEQLPGLGATAHEFARRWPGVERVARVVPARPEADDDEHPTGRAPRLTFNEPIGPNRIYASGSVSIERLVALRSTVYSESFPVSFNAFVLAVWAGALRRWLIDNEELPTSPVVAVVPILVGGADADEDAHVAGITVPLPTNLADPVARVEATARNLRRAKDRYGEIPLSLAQDVSMFAPPLLASLANRLTDAMPHRRILSPTVNLGITNVPGPARQVYLAGRPLRSSHPVLSVTDVTPLHIGVQAGASALGLGAIADGDTVEDLDALIVAFDAELSSLSGVGPASS